MTAGAATVVRTLPVMGTVATLQVVLPDPAARADAEAATSRAADWLLAVERCCSRFDPESELRRLCEVVGAPVPVSEMLFVAIRTALALARLTDGAFDPAVGGAQQARGFDREHRTGTRAAAMSAPGATFRDLTLDDEARTVTLAAPLILDLGAIAKGLAVDLAAKELAAWRDVAIDAGGDQWFTGTNADGEPWRVGIRHPADGDAVIETLAISNAAICTSGGYETQGLARDAGHHIVDARSGASPHAVASATVLGPSAMIADGLSTVAMLLPPRDALALIIAHGARGVLYLDDLQRMATPDLAATA